MTSMGARPIYYLKNGRRDVLRSKPKPGKIDQRNNERGVKKTSHLQDQRRTTMSTMNASYFIEKVGHGVLNTFLLAALPTALVATLIQGL